MQSSGKPSFPTQELIENKAKHYYTSLTAMYFHCSCKQTSLFMLPHGGVGQFTGEREGGRGKFLLTTKFAYLRPFLLLISWSVDIIYSKRTATSILIQNMKSAQSANQNSGTVTWRQGWPLLGGSMTPCRSSASSHPKGTNRVRDWCHLQVYLLFQELTGLVQKPLLTWCNYLALYRFVMSKLQVCFWLNLVQQQFIIYLGFWLQAYSETVIYRKEKTKTYYMLAEKKQYKTYS